MILTSTNSLHRLLNCEIGGLDCHVITTEYKTRVQCTHMCHLFCNTLVHMIYSVVSGQYSYTIADPLCSRVIKKNSGFECNYNFATNKSFDQECGQAKALYKNALHVF